jgi:hypothetical protein
VTRIQSPESTHSESASPPSATHRSTVRGSGFFAEIPCVGTCRFGNGIRNRHRPTRGERRLGSNPAVAPVNLDGAGGWVGCGHLLLRSTRAGGSEPSPEGGWSKRGSPAPCSIFPYARASTHRAHKSAKHVLRLVTKHRHMGGMATYTVTSQTDRRGGFDIAIVGHDGVRQTILGFRAPAGLLRLVRPLAQRSARTHGSDDDGRRGWYGARPRDE